MKYLAAINPKLAISVFGTLWLLSTSGLLYIWSVTF